VEEIAGYRGLLSREPGNPVLNDDLALLYLEIGRADEAARHFEQALRLRPDSVAGFFNLGTALMLAGRAEAAAVRLNEAVRLKPDYAAAHNNLGNALAAQHKLNEALQHYRAALQVWPDYARAHNGIATVLMEQGRLEEALGYLRTAVANDPALAEAHHNLGLTQRARGHSSEAAEHFREAVRLRPDSPTMVADYAWILATAQDAALRDAQSAIRLAETAAALTRRLEARILRVVAAARAEAGQFEHALTAVDVALALSPAEGLRAALEADRELYLRRRRLRTGAPP
jgi:tetratricopeptide (TPR) repeat protein